METKNGMELRDIRAITTPLLYIASPYSIPKDLTDTLNYGQIKAIYEYRVKSAAAVGAFFLHGGNNIFNPITHTHEMNIIARSHNNKEITSEQWLAFDTFYLQRCDILILNKDIGWDKSEGIHYEMGIVDSRGKSIIPVDPTMIHDIEPPQYLKDYYHVS